MFRTDTSHKTDGAQGTSHQQLGATAQVEHGEERGDKSYSPFTLTYITVVGDYINAMKNTFLFYLLL